MNSVRRQQKNIDKARGRLVGWAMNSSENVDGIVRTVETLVRAVTRHSGRPSEEVRAALAQDPFVTATRILAMYVWLTGEDDADRTSAPLARYLAERGWRESPVGRRWLRQLAEARFELRDVVDMTPDASLRLGAPRGAGAPVTVHEPRLASELSLGLVMYARVLPMPAGAVLADGLLMLDRHLVAGLPASARTTGVFAAWASEALVAEGHLAAAPPESRREPPRRPPRRPPREPSHELPPDSRPPRETAGDPPPDRPTDASRAPLDRAAREKLLARVRKLFAMAQETEASPHEAEIALRRCQSLMARFGITERDLETSEFGRRTAHTGKRVPMHIQFLSIAVARLHGVLFVSGGGQQAHFRGYEIDVHVAGLTLDYLSDAVERALAARRRTGEFPPGRTAAYDYRLAFAEEVIERVETIASEREAKERAASTTGTALTVRKVEVVERECGRDLVSSTLRGRGVIDDTAADAGRADGSRVSLDPQVGRADAPRSLGRN